jgi:hypothetical protein
MKKTELAMIVLIASVSVLVAYFATTTLFGDMSGESVNVKTIESITSEISEPDPAIFNEDAINPVVEVQVGSAEQ